MSCIAEKDHRASVAYQLVWGQTPLDTKMKATESGVREPKSVSEDQVNERYSRSIGLFPEPYMHDLYRLLCRSRRQFLPECPRHRKCARRSHWFAATERSGAAHDHENLRIVPPR